MKSVFKVIFPFLIMVISRHVLANTLDPATVNDVETAYNNIIGTNGTSFSATAVSIKSIVYAIALTVSGWAVFGLYHAYVAEELDSKGVVFMLGRLLAMLSILLILMNL